MHRVRAMVATFNMSEKATKFLAQATQLQEVLDALKN